MIESVENENIKEPWNNPELIILNTKKTQSGDTPDTPEEMGYDPVISP